MMYFELNNFMECKIYNFVIIIKLTMLIRSNKLIQQIINNYLNLINLLFINLQQQTKIIYLYYKLLFY